MADNKHIMKNTKYLFITLAAVISVGCDKQKAVIDENTEATKEAIDERKDDVDAAAKEATRQTEANADDRQGENRSRQGIHAGTT